MLANSQCKSGFPICCPFLFFLRDSSWLYTCGVDAALNYEAIRPLDLLSNFLLNSTRNVTCFQSLSPFPVLWELVGDRGSSTVALTLRSTLRPVNKDRLSREQMVFSTEDCAARFSDGLPASQHLWCVILYLNLDRKATGMFRSLGNKIYGKSQRVSQFVQSILLRPMECQAL